MKNFKLALLAVVALLSFSCDKDDSETTATSSETSFIGDFVVTSPSGTSEGENVVFVVELDPTTYTASVTMESISFVSAMPAQTMTLPDMPYSVQSGVTTISADSVVPEIAGLPYDSYTISNFVGVIDNQELSVTFSCLSVYSVEYTGVEE